MKVLYIECAMGAAGDMLMSALSDISQNSDEFIERINNLNIPKVVLRKNTISKCGINGTHISVAVDGAEEHEHHDHEHEHHDHEHEHA